MVGRWITLAEVAKLGQRRWDEVPVLSGSQVQILPPAPSAEGFEPEWVYISLVNVERR